MFLRKLQLTTFRNFQNLSIEPSSSLNLIVGRNGSGKSSLLESIYYLGYGRSFRTNKATSVIQHEQEKFTIFAGCSAQANSEVLTKVGLSRTRDDGFTCSINGQHSNRLSDLVSMLPVQMFTPQSTDLVIGSPSERRRFCDWGLFHVEQSYQQLAQNYSRLLRQRNALLKSNGSSQDSSFAYWQEQLALLGERLNQYRDSYINALKPIFIGICEQFLPEFSVEIAYYRGWEKELDLASALQKKLTYDQKIGHTSVGPHKGDLRFKVDSLNAQEVLSRGQLRMAVAALQLAQTQLFSTSTQRSSIFLLDDIGAELDEDKRERFISALVDTGTQLFVTAIEKEQLEFVDRYSEKKMFHVEHGHVKEE